MQVYSSANWVYAIENPKGAYMNYTPTLFDISNVFGADTMVNWVATNVMAIWYVKPDNNPQIYDQAKAWAIIKMGKTTPVAAFPRALSSLLPIKI